MKRIISWLQNSWEDFKICKKDMQGSILSTPVCHLDINLKVLVWKYGAHNFEFHSILTTQLILKCYIYLREESQDMKSKLGCVSSAISCSVFRYLQIIEILCYNTSMCCSVNMSNIISVFGIISDLGLKWRKISSCNHNAILKGYIRKITSSDPGPGINDSPFSGVPFTYFRVSIVKEPQWWKVLNEHRLIYILWVFFVKALI